jgi:predicted outer membrane repeat protein
MLKKTWIAVLFAVLSVYSLAQSVYYVRSSGDDSRCGMSEADAWQTVDHAVATAEFGSTVDIEGTFTVSGELQLGRRLTLSGHGRDATVIQGAAVKNGSTVGRLFTLTDEAELTLRDMTLRFGGYQGSALSGGALSGVGTTVSVTCERVTFSGNTAASGGAVYLEGATASFSDCRFSDNFASDSQGGAIYAISSSVRKFLSLKVSRTLFDNNVSQKEGSALRAGSGSVSAAPTSVSVENSTFFGNVNGTGGSTSNAFGALFLDGNATTAYVNHVLKNNTVAFNRRNSAYASQSLFTSGLYVNNNQNVTLINNIFFGNDGCDLQQRANADYKIYSASNNICGLVRNRSGSACSVADIALSASGNVDNVTAENLKLSTLLTAYNGTFVLPLAAGSVAIGAGLTGSGMVTVDQGGTARDAAIDAGAYEYVLPTAVDAVADANPKVYPTLFDRMLFFADASEKSVGLYAMTGEMVFKKGGITGSVMLPSLPQGGYLLRVTTNSGSYMYRLLRR